MSLDFFSPISVFQSVDSVMVLMRWGWDGRNHGGPGAARKGVGLWCLYAKHLMSRVLSVRDLNGQIECISVRIRSILFFSFWENAVLWCHENASRVKGFRHWLLQTYVAKRQKSVSITSLFFVPSVAFHLETQDLVGETICINRQTMKYQNKRIFSLQPKRLWISKSCSGTEAIDSGNGELTCRKAHLLEAWSTLNFETGQRQSLSSSFFQEH